MSTSANERAVGSIPPIAGPADDCLATLDPGPHLADLELAWQQPLAATPTVLLGDRVVGPLEMADAFHAHLRLPAAGAGDLTITATGLDQTPRQWSIPLGWQSVSRETALTYWGGERQVRVVLPHHTFFEDAYIWAAVASNRHEMVERALPPGLVRVSPLFRVEPAALALDARVDLGLALPAGEAVARVCLYRFDSRDQEHVWEGDVVEARLVTGKVRRLGYFFLARDDEPPTIRPLTPRDGELLRTAEPAFRARVADLESGLDEAEVYFSLDGEILPTEWDPDSDEIRYQPRHPLPAGRHRLEIRAADRAGNHVTQSLSLTIRP